MLKKEVIELLSKKIAVIEYEKCFEKCYELTEVALDAHRPLKTKEYLKIALRKVKKLPIKNMIVN